MHFAVHIAKMTENDTHKHQPTTCEQVSLSAQEILELSEPCYERTAQVSLSIQQILDSSLPTISDSPRVTLSAQQILDLSHPCNNYAESDEYTKTEKISGSVTYQPKTRSGKASTSCGNSVVTDEELKISASEGRNIVSVKERTFSNTTADDVDPCFSDVIDHDATLKSKIVDKLHTNDNSRHRPVVESRPGPGFRDRTASVDSQDFYFEDNGGNSNINYNDNMIGIKKDDVDTWDTTLPIAAEVVPDNVGLETNARNAYESDAPLAFATAIPKSNKKRKQIVYTLVAGVVLLVVVVIAVVATKIASDDDNNSLPPHYSTKNYKGQNLKFNETFFFKVSGVPIVPKVVLDAEHNNTPEWYFGSSVSLSVQGHRLAVGAPGSPNSSTGESFVSIYSVQSRRNVTTWLLDIPGEVPYDATGRSVSLSGTGDYVAIGSPNFYAQLSSNRSSGSVRVHIVNVSNASDQATSEQVGSVLSGLEPGDQFGWLVELSQSGDILLVAAKGACYLQAFKLSSLSESNSDWVQYGQTINCSGNYEDDDSKDVAIHLSNDGSTIVFGEPKTQNGGIVRVFKYNASGTGSWIQSGNTLEGEKPGDEFGAAVTSTEDGQVIGVCAPMYAVAGSSVGRCTFYSNGIESEINTTVMVMSSWKQEGLHLYGDNVDIRFGAAISSIESNFNTRFVAISAVDDRSFAESDKGFAQVYEYIPEENLWNPFSKHRLFQTGTGISLSYQHPEVITVAVGTSNNKTSTSRFAGEVNLYKNSVRETNGGVNAKVVFHIDNPYATFHWTLDRMDAMVCESTLIQEGLAETSRRIEFVVPNEAVYRISTDTGYIESLEVNGAPVPLAGLESKRQTFLARSEGNVLGTRVGQKFISLSINFDANPEEVQWVLIAEDAFTSRRSVLAFGPEKGAKYDPQQLTDRMEIDVSNVPTDSKYYVLVTDDGNNGFGNSSMHVYVMNGSNPDSTDVLNATNAEWKKRYSHCFFISEEYCNCCFPKEVIL